MSQRPAPSSRTRPGSRRWAVAIVVIAGLWAGPAVAGDPASFFGWGATDETETAGTAPGRGSTLEEAEGPAPSEGVLNDLGEAVDVLWSLPWAIPVAVSDELDPRLDDWPTLQQGVRFWGCYGEQMGGRGAPLDPTGAPEALEAARSCIAGSSPQTAPDATPDAGVVELVVVGEACAYAQAPRRVLGLGVASRTCAELCAELADAPPHTARVVIDTTEGSHRVVESLRDCLADAGFERPAVRSR